MNEEKQIEEMARVLCEDCGRDVAPCSLTKSGRMCDSVREQAEALYNANYRKQEWISVDERLPEKDGMYLIFSPYTNKEGGIVYCNRFLTKGNTIFPPNSFESISGVTHWMPLPEAPKMKGDSDA